MRKLVTVIAAALAIGHPASVLGSPAEPAEATISEAAEPILVEETLPNQPGDLDLRFGLDVQRPQGGVLGDQLVQNVSLFFGLIPDLGGELTVPYVHADPLVPGDRGFGRAELGLKYRFGSFARLPWVVRAELGLPPASMEPESPGSRFGLALSTVNVRSRTSWQGGVGYETNGDPGDAEWSYAVSLAVTAGAGLRLHAESTGAFAVRGTDSEAHAGPGFTWAANGFSLGAGCFLALTREASPVRLACFAQRQF